MRSIASGVYKTILGSVVFGACTLTQAQSLVYDVWGMSFTNTAPGSTSAPIVRSVTNTTAGDVVITAIVLPPNPPFNITHNCPIAPLPLAGGASCQITGTFTAPAAAGTSTGSVRVQAEGASTIALTLNGVSAGPTSSQPLLAPQAVPATGPLALILASIAMTGLAFVSKRRRLK